MPLEVKAFSEDEERAQYRIVIPGRAAFISDFNNGTREIVAIMCNKNDDGFNIIALEEDKVIDLGGEMQVRGEAAMQGEVIGMFDIGGEYKRKYREPDGSISTLYAKHLGGVARYYVINPN